MQVQEKWFKRYNVFENSNTTQLGENDEEANHPYNVLCILHKLENHVLILSTNHINFLLGTQVLL